MEHIAVQVFLLLLGVVGWALCASPMLRYMIDLAEGRFRWQLVMWFVLMILSIFLMKFALYTITGWPGPGTWGSRLFLGIALVASYAVPFINEFIRGWRNK
jgi:hypothetical protein